MVSVLDHRLWKTCYEKQKPRTQTVIQMSSETYNRFKSDFRRNSPLVTVLILATGITELPQSGSKPPRQEPFRSPDEKNEPHKEHAIRPKAMSLTKQKVCREKAVAKHDGNNRAPHHARLSSTPPFTRAAANEWISMNRRARLRVQRCYCGNFTKVF